MEDSILGTQESPGATGSIPRGRRVRGTISELAEFRLSFSAREIIPPPVKLVSHVDVHPGARRMAVGRYVGPVGSFTEKARPYSDRTGAQRPGHRPKPSVFRHHAAATY